VHIETFEYLPQQTRCGFVAITAAVRGVAAEEDAIDVTTHAGELLMQFGMDGVEVIEGEVTKGQPGLIGGDGDTAIGLIEASDGLQGTADRLPLFRRADGELSG